MSAKAKEKELTFEKAMERLEEIVADMENGAASLDQATAYFEEGNRMVQFCTQKLNEVERKIEMLVQQGGQVKSVPFEATPTEDAPRAPDASAGGSDLFETR